MAGLAFPVTNFPDNTTTTNVNIGAAQKQKSSTTAGFPVSLFPDNTTAMYVSMGASQKANPAAGGNTTNFFLMFDFYE
jgi:hypothetical protein